VDPLPRLYAGLRRRWLAGVSFCNASDCEGGGMFRPTVRLIWTPAPLSNCTALSLSRSVPSSPPWSLRCALERGTELRLK